MKKYPGYSFSFFCWIRLRDHNEDDIKTYKTIRQRRQLYSFYNDNGQGFEAFFTNDASSLVVSLCTRKEFHSVQISDLKIVSKSPPISTSDESPEFDEWHSIAVVYIPAKNPFHSSKLCIYVDGKLVKEADTKLPNFYEAFTHNSICAACIQPQTISSNNPNMSTSLTTPLSSVKSLFSFGGSKTPTKTDPKSLSVSSIPCGTQDLVWDTSTCLLGQLSCCFALHDQLQENQVKILHRMGPNTDEFGNTEVTELHDLKAKLMFYYHAKYANDSTCFDLSHHNMNAELHGKYFTLNSFKVKSG